MAKIYNVIHHYEMDRGPGNKKSKDDTIATFKNYTDAKAFVDNFAKPRIIEKPCGTLRCGKLVIVESDTVQDGNLNTDDIDTSNFWWLHNPCKPCIKEGK